MILLDTNVLSEPMKPQPSPKVMAWLNQQPLSTLYTSSITKAEIGLGIALLPEGKRKQALYRAFMETMETFGQRCLPFGAEEATVFAEIVACSQQEGRRITVEDGQIASIAICRNLTLATRNIRDFEKIKELKIFNPFD